MSFPTAKDILEELFLNSGDSRRSRSMTALFSLFGTSIPTAAFPGIGASIRISAAARFSLISSARPTILLTLTPISGCNSYLVTEGPQLTLVMVTFTPKFSSVCCSFIAVSLKCASDSPPPRFPLWSRDNGGYWYSFFGFTESAATLAATSATSPAIPAAPIFGFLRLAGFSCVFGSFSDSGVFFSGSFVMSSFP